MELRKILEENDLGGDILSYHSGGLTKAKIDTALVAAGHSVPVPQKVTFHLYKMNGINVSDVFLVSWLPLIDGYGIEKLTLKR